MEKELETVIKVKFGLSATYNWSVGKYMDRYIKELKNKKFLGIKCPNCGHIYLPPRMICRNCFTKMDEWVEVSDKGTVESFTIGQVKIDENTGELKELEKPEILGLIRHDKTDSCVVYRIGEIEPRDVKAGMRVKAAWIDEPKGDLGDVKYYKPIEVKK